MDVSSANSAYMRLSQTISGTERYIRDNNTAQTQLNSSISQGTSKAQSFVNAIMGLSVVQSVIGVVKGQIDSAITRMDTMTNYNRTMTAITGSSDAASASLEKLKQVTTGTAYGLDTAASGVQNFVTRGLSLGTAVDQVSDWADAVAFYGDGTNETLSTVTDALGKMLSKGTVEMEQLNRLTDAGINAVGIYAQATGQATATVQDNLSAGKISSQEFITTVTSAFENGTNGVLNISGAAKEAGGTWATSISNAKAAVTRGVIDMVDGINDGLANAGFGSLLNGVTEFGVQAENVLSKLGTTTGQVITAISPVINTVIGIFSYISDNANITLSSVLNGVVGFVNATVSVLQPILSMVGTISSFIVDNWGSIIPIIAGIVTVMLTYNGALATYNAIMAISETITAAKAFASQVHAAALAMESGATFLATAGQLGFNAALLACPVTWIVIGIVAIVAAVVALANHIAKSGGVATTTFGVICGAVATAGAFIWNIVLGLVNSVITIGVNLWNLIQNFVAAFSIVFNNPIAAIETAFLSMFNFIVGIVSSAASIIDTVFGSNLADTVEGFQDKIQAQINATVENSQGYTPNTLNASDYTLERKNYSDTYASGAKWGDNVSNKIKNALSSKLTTTDTKSSKYGGTDLSDYSSALGSINNNTAKTADSASKAAKSLDVTSEDLKYLRDIAERDVINRYTTASITVNQTNHNTVNNDMDLDGVTEHLRSTLEEQMNMAAEGVY
jgi:tape measure domain-containing protein